MMMGGGLVYWVTEERGCGVWRVWYVWRVRRIFNNRKMTYF